jgi:hypothetical protein
VDSYLNSFRSAGLRYEFIIVLLSHTQSLSLGHSAVLFALMVGRTPNPSV